MSYPDRKPEIEMLLSKEDFNGLLELLTISSNSNDDWLQETATALKTKIMEYTFVEDEKASIKFFPREASWMLFILFIYSKEYEPSEDYYSKMKERFYEKHPDKKTQQLDEDK